MIAFLSVGLLLGLSAGFSPGPLLALVISQTVQHGIREGIKVALAPLITDLPIIVIATVVLACLADSRVALGLISLAGGLFVLYLAYESLRTTRLETSAAEVAPRSLRKGAIVNALNPQPYLFWLTVGVPTMLKARRESLAAAAGFVVGFYVCLIGAKVLAAWLAGRSRRRLVGKPYAYLMRILGLLLLIFALLLLRDGLSLLGMFRAIALTS